MSNTIVPQHKLLMLCINDQSYKRSGCDIYKAASKAWRISKKHQKETEYVCAVRNQEVEEVFKVDETSWSQCGQAKCVGKNGHIKQTYWMFDENDAPEDVRNLYIWMRIPKRFGKGGYYYLG